jgi:uncharacterized protein DUF6152
MRIELAAVAAGIGVLLSAGAAVAHHSYSAEFDANKAVKLTGAVTKVDWQNPHTLFYIDVKDDAGKVVNWGWEMASPTQLMRAGWTRTSMKIGDVVTVEGTRARDGTNYANARVIVLTSTGKQLFAGSSQGQ